MSDDPNAQELLFRAIARPFFEDPDPGEPINLWYTWLSENCPLWTFQTEEFMRLQETELPSTDPLETIIGSVLRDEGWDYHGFRFGPPGPYQLVENVYARREELGEGKRRLFSTCYVFQESDASRRTQVSHPPGLRWLAEPPEIVDWDDEGPIGTHTVYEEIGRELVWLLQAVKRAEPGSDERGEAEDRLDAFLHDVGARAPAHRPSSDPPDEILQRLYEEGRALLDELWNPLAVGPDDPARDILAELDADEEEFRDWALRLAVPALSWAELQALEAQYSEAATWAKTGPRPTARRLTIWLLAHRLDSPPERLANKLGAGSDWHYFDAWPNPVEEFLPDHE